jgi:hypothetical protein
MYVFEKNLKSFGGAMLKISITHEFHTQRSATTQHVEKIVYK